MFKYLLACLCLFTAWNSVAQTRMIAEAVYEYDDLTGLDIPYDSITYKYNSGRGGAVNEAMNYDTSVFYYTQNPQWPYTSQRTLQKFDASNHIVSILVEKHYFGTWPDYSRYNCAYNASGQLTSDTFAYDPFVQYSVGVYSYNSAGYIDTSISLSKYNTQYDTSRRNLYTYDGNNNVTEIISQVVEADTFLTTWTCSYTYNTANLCTYQFERRIQHPSTPFVEDDLAYVNEYDVNNNLTIQYYLGRNSSGILDTTLKTVHYYDNGNLLVGKVVEIKRAGLWMKEDSTYMTYNTDRHCTYKRIMKWSGSAWIDNGLCYSVHYYYEPYDPSTVHEVAADRSSLQIWPVPSSGNIHLHLQEASQNQYTVSVYDMHGRQVMQDYYFSNTTQSFNTNTLPAGNYNLILKGDKGGVQHSKFTVVK